ncbi:sigma-54-dependent transcriptional regulator [Nitrospina watsonii]|uniref:DNA-binding transcriptional regulator NtrC n=1 Tax=Nitrospina watsonii TaxID=1323948 RepID=A0ABM9HBI1_9BACT|nr:sigma-54 dependent transcriptional regulator [Nitrospina watsonii]CAI2717477.1 DNA-binding transcriptional regulator NtrC [Nitrospina watsonii]
MSGSKDILIVDDEENIRWLFTQALEDSPYRVDTACSGEEALQKIRGQSYFMVFTDIFMEGISGLELLQKVRDTDHRPHIVVMTAQDTMNNTIEAMRHGAYDYISKPFDFDEIFKLIDKVEKSRDVRPPEQPAATAQEDFSLEAIIGKNRRMQDIFKVIGKAASTLFPVLITGESGTGKELVARALHHYSNRSQKPFIFINCAAISRELLESELFGHEKGSFTGAVEAKKGKFELADGGTLMLDEIGDMELPLQAKILRVLQNSEFYRVGGKDSLRVDVRIIAATNQRLPDLMKADRFREDLYHRLNVINIHMPPLRERVEDIPLLAEFFLKKYGDASVLDQVYLSPETAALLKQYPWPGNIRELENVIKRCLVLVTRGPVLPEHLPEPLLEAARKTPAAVDAWQTNLDAVVHDFLAKNRDSGDGNLYDLLIQEVEKHLFEQMLDHKRGNQVATSKSLGINRNTLKRKIDAMGIDPKKKHSDSNLPPL